MPGHLRRRHLRCPVAVVQGPDAGFEGRVCLCECCGGEELRGGCERTSEFAFILSKKRGRWLTMGAGLGFNIRAERRGCDYCDASAEFVGR